MANAFTYQILRDTTEKAVIKLTGFFDGSGQEANSVRIQANTLYGALDANNVPLRSALSVSNTALPYYGLAVHKLWYDCVNNTEGGVEVFWNANVPRTIFYLSGTYEYDSASNWITIPNNARGEAGCYGDIGVRSFGYQANSSYTIILELRKDNAMYQRGQFNDPAAFNYPPYGLEPQGN